MLKLKNQKINIGGDHSMAIATVADSINKYDDIRLVWVDAHADLNTYEKSISKNYHGMPLSFLTGLDKNPFFSFIKNHIPLKHILYIGIRELDPFEQDIIQQNNMQVITIKDIRTDYFNSMNKLFKFINKNPVHLSFDVDVMDPSIIYSTGTKVPNGLYIEEAQNILRCLSQENIVNMDITELNLSIGDKNQVYMSFINFIKIFHNILPFHKS